MSVAEATVPAGIARAIFTAAEARGVARDALVSASGFDPDLLEDGDARAPALRVARLWSAAGELTGSDTFGLDLGASTPSSTMPLAGRLIAASGSLGDGLARVFAYYRVFNDVHPAEITAAEDQVTVEVHTKAIPLALPRHAVEFAFAWFVAVASRAVGEPVALTRVTFEHAAPRADRGMHERVFGCPVDFDAPRTTMVLPLALLARPNASPDPELVELLESHAQNLLAKLPARAGTAQRVRAVLGELLPRGDASIELAAEALGASPRSLQRKLREEGTTFSEVVDELRCELAKEHLRGRASSIAQIALLVGFSDQSTFHRAFVRWTGKTPGDFRRGL